MNLSVPPPASVLTRPVIESDRLSLRPLALSDLPHLERWAADRRIAEGTRSIPHPLPQGAALSFIQQASGDSRDEDIWAIDGTPSQRPAFLGVISLKTLERGQSQIGYWVVPDSWQSGVASEAVRAIVAANPHRNRTLFAEVFQDNPVSARLLVNAGFEYISDAEAYSTARGVSVPTWTYLRRMA